jgi:methyl-accepting chemotaxis protein
MGLNTGISEMAIVKWFLNLSVRAKFAVLLLSLVCISVGSFTIFGQYSLSVFKQEFEKRGELLANTLNNQSQFSLAMEDVDALKDLLKSLVSNGSIAVGSFYDKDGQQLALIGNEDMPNGGINFAEITEMAWIKNRKGEKRLLVKHKVMTDDNKDEVLGYVTFTVPANSLEVQQSVGMQINLAGIVMFILLGIGVMWIFKKVMIEPVKTLSLAAQKVANGDFDVHVDGVTHDEIGDLIDSFNKMVENNRKLFAEVNDRSKEADEARQKSEEMQQKILEEQAYLQQQFEKIGYVIREVTKGNLTTRLEIERDDAVGRLMKNINKMIADLNELISQVHFASESVAKASGKIASSVDELSEGARQQAMQTQEVANAVEEMAQTVNHSSHNANDAAQIALHTSQLAYEGEQVFRSTLDGMRNVAKIVKDSAGTVEKLGRSSQEIGEIVQVIDDIADQTNLLALNAAIEAARAGEQGRGFAVVADEVRKLAERTTSATAKIADMIKRIQAETNLVVKAMEEGSIEAEKGMEMADKANESLSAVIHSITQITENINQIASGIQQQSSTGEEISLRVEQISAEAKTVAEAADELSSISMNLNALTHQLNGSVKHFVIKKSEAVVPETSKTGANGIPA